MHCNADANISNGGAIVIWNLNCFTCKSYSCKCCAMTPKKVLIVLKNLNYMHGASDIVLRKAWFFCNICIDIMHFTQGSGCIAKSILLPKNPNRQKCSKKRWWSALSSPLWQMLLICELFLLIQAAPNPSRGGRGDLQSGDTFKIWWWVKCWLPPIWMK